MTEDTKRELPLLLRYREAADLLAVSERFVQDLANAGRLERVRLGDMKAARITTDSVRKLAAQRNDDPKDAA